MSNSSHLEAVVSKLNKQLDLTREETMGAAHALASAEVDAVTKKAFLIALAKKGESPEEVAAFAGAFREMARDPELSDYAAEAIDIVGTGGDKSGSFNISTATSFILAASGHTVLKHGNRSITSKCGSADLISAVGIDLEVDNAQLRQNVEQFNFTFFFAPAFHPAFKEIMPVRKALAESGQRTIFNILGPLINPGRPQFQLMGVFSKAWVKPLAGALHQLGLKNGLVVHCDLGDDKGMDELSLAGTNHVAGFGELADFEATWTPADLGLEACPLEALQGGDLEVNQAILEKFASCQAPPALFETVALNVGAALWILGKASGIQEGIEQARGIMKSDQLQQWLKQVQSAQ